MKYYIIAGEASGDLLGSYLIKALRDKDPEAQIRYWGGDKMCAVAGCEPVRHIRDLAIMGFVEVVLHLRTVLGNISFCKQDILQYKPDVVVGVDYPGFNLKIEQFAHEHGFKTLHYVSPQLWAWKKGRIKGMRRNLDRLCYILPFEQQFYAQNRFPQAVYVGHPLLDLQHERSEADDSQLSTHNSQLTIALLPGSRRQEIQRVLPMMLDLADRHAEYRFVIAGMMLIGEMFYKQLIGNRTNVEVLFDKTYSLLSSAHAAVVCSGTATLETALFNVPQVVCYRANPISIAIARKLVGRRVKYISLVNLIADAPVVTELIQGDMDLNTLGDEFLKVANEGPEREHILQGYTQVRQLLGDGGASERVARQIITLANKNSTI